VGTRYGRLLLLKIALLVPVLTLAAVNRSVHLPSLSGDGATVGRPAMRRLARFVVAEGALALAILAVVGAMVVTPPARHEPPEWPFSFRLSLVALEGAPDAATRALVGSQLAVLGLVGVVAALVRHVWRLRLLAGGIIVLAAGAGLALPPLALDAYPTTYLRPAVPYQATAIATGAALYQTNCAVCHGTTGAAVGPTPTRALKEYRGRRIVLLVLYALPGSRPRMAQLAQSYDVLVTLGAEVIAVPTDATPDALKRLGAEPRVLFPVVTDGAAEI